MVEKQKETERKGKYMKRNRDRETETDRKRGGRQRDRQADRGRKVKNGCMKTEREKMRTCDIQAGKQEGNERPNL